MKSRNKMKLIRIVFSMLVVFAMALAWNTKVSYAEELRAHNALDIAKDEFTSYGSEEELQVGRDIAPGEYVVLSNSNISGYFCIYSSATMGTDDIIENDLFEYNRIIKIENGNYLKLERCNIVPVQVANLDVTRSGGMYKVGRDIAPGTYHLTKTSEYSAYYSVHFDALGADSDIVKNNLFDGTATVSLQSGQYIKLDRCKADFIQYVGMNTMTLNSETTSLFLGKSSKLTVGFTPENATIGNITWSSSNPTIVGVDSDGKITSYNYGSAMITASCDGMTAQCNVVVSDTIYNGVDYAAVYNREYYADNNLDVRNVTGYDAEGLLWHFVTFGMAEGRCAKQDFNVVKYMYGLLNDDLRAAFGGDMQKYYLHYMQYGKNEGRGVSVSDWDAVFDAKYYLEANPDVKENIVSRYTADGNLYGWALWHYCEFGANEGRHANAQFGVLNYEAANPDVYQAYGKDLKAATIHYLQFGSGRSLKPEIDIYQLPKTRPDVISIFGINNPVAWVDWYINYGRFNE